MTEAQARSLLRSGVAGLPYGGVDEALALTGRWPVLLSLVHGILADETAAGADPATELADVLAALRTAGVTALDVDDPRERQQTVRATLEVSLRRLAAEERARFEDLAVFGAEVSVPGDVVARLWRHVAGWSAVGTRRFCRRLDNLGLLAGYRRDPDRILVHDVVLAYLRHVVGGRLPATHGSLVDAHRELLGPGGTWADLPAERGYLWTRLIAHLDAAGLHHERERTLADPRWLAAKLEIAGPASLQVDLGLASNATSRALATAVRRSAHVLEPLDPPGSLAATLASRLPRELESVGDRLLSTVPGGHLRPVVPLPDLPDPALMRALPIHTGGYRSIVG